MTDSTAIDTETRTKCKAHDPVNERLLHEVCKYVYYDTLGCFARDLDITTSRIRQDHSTQYVLCK